ncbi:MAG: hypothetical protein LC667_06890 [Thioalkalivibrio sp.]|nr:hypothetical protein [Thioalkalivibrio sp.]
MIQRRNDLTGYPTCLFALEPLFVLPLPDLDTKTVHAVAGPDARPKQVGPPEGDNASIIGSQLDPGPPVQPVVPGFATLRQHTATHDPQSRTAHCDPADRDHGTRSVEHRPPAPPTELVAVTPGREFGTQRLADTHEFESFTEAGQADLIGRDAHPGLAEKPLAGLDRFPALFEGRQVPALTPAADHP